MSPQIVMVLEAIGASGIVTLITGFMTYRLSGKKQSTAEPNGARTRLQDEVLWLRHQLEISREK